MITNNDADQDNRKPEAIINDRQNKKQRKTVASSNKDQEQKQSSSSLGLFDALDHHVQTYICSFLDVPVLGGTCTKVCKHFNRLAKQNALWVQPLKRLLMDEYGKVVRVRYYRRDWSDHLRDESDYDSYDDLSFYSDEYRLSLSLSRLEQQLGQLSNSNQTWCAQFKVLLMDLYANGFWFKPKAENYFQSMQGRPFVHRGPLSSLRPQIQ